MTVSCWRQARRNADLHIHGQGRELEVHVWPDLGFQIGGFNRPEHRLNLIEFVLRVYSRKYFGEQRMNCPQSGGIVRWARRIGMQAQQVHRSAFLAETR